MRIQQKLVIAGALVALPLAAGAFLRQPRQVQDGARLFAQVLQKIEDNAVDARLIQIMLSEAGSGLFDLEHADRLSSGLKRLSQGDIGIVLLDLSLPDSMGLQT